MCRQIATPILSFLQDFADFGATDTLDQRGQIAGVTDSLVLKDFFPKSGWFGGVLGVNLADFADFVDHWL